MWSSASPRSFAASMPIARFSFSLVCPVKSFRRRGRRPASNWASPSWADAETMRGSAIRFSLAHQFERAAEERLERRLGAEEALSLSHGGFGGGARASQVEQRRENVLIDRIERGGRLRGLVSGGGG